MILLVTYRGKPMCLDVQEHCEETDCTSLFDSAAVGIRSLRGTILAGMPSGLMPGQEFRVRSQGLHARFLLMTKQGAIRSNGVCRLPAKAGQGDA